MIKRPCAHCPFRADIEPYLRPERCEEIRDSLTQGGMFPCHETVDHYARSRAGERWCAGALLIMEEEFGAGASANQMVRICEGLGDLDLDQLEDTGVVFESFDEWVEANRKGERLDRRGSRKSKQ